MTFIIKINGYELTPKNKLQTIKGFALGLSKKKTGPKKTNGHNTIGNKQMTRSTLNLISFSVLSKITPKII